MSLRHLKRCERCDKKYRGQSTWNVTVVSGIATGLLCPACQTSEEHLEAEVNLATIDYQGVDVFGRLVGVPKGVADAD